MRRKIGPLENELKKVGTEIQKLQAVEALLQKDLDFTKSIIDC